MTAGFPLNRLSLHQKVVHAGLCGLSTKQFRTERLKSALYLRLEKCNIFKIVKGGLFGTLWGFWKSSFFAILETFRNENCVTASSGTAISTNIATLTCWKILSKILIRCVTWHWACDCSFRCFHKIGRYFDNKEQERAKTRARHYDRSQRRQEHPKMDSFWGANPGFYRFLALCYPM